MTHFSLYLPFNTIIKQPGQSSLTRFVKPESSSMASTTTTTASSAALAPATAAAPPPDPSSLLPLPSKSDLCHSYVGLPLSSLPTPSLILDRAVIRRNCARMAKIADNWGVTLRAHVKTHKTAEGTREMMTNGQGSGRVLVSTLAEGWGILRGGLAKEGVVRDVSSRANARGRRSSRGAKLAHTT